MRRVERAYLTRGMLETITQYNATASGTATDQVRYTYDGWGNPTAFEQDPDGLIGAGGRAAFSTQWSWTKATPTNASPHLRRTGTTYAGLTTTYTYGSGGLEDMTGRLLKLTQSAVDLAHYTYMGAAGVALTSLPEPDVERGVGYTSGQTYGNVDNFGRITRDTWVWPAAATWHDLAITYDRNSGITSIEDDSDDVSGAIDDNWDWKFTQDGLERLEDADRGNLASGSISARTFRQDWALSQTGNWSTFRIDGNGDSTWDATDTRTHNVANELLTRSTPSATLAHDAAGQMTDDGVSYVYVYDAWGRLRRVKNRSTTHPIIEYTYNGLGHRISERTDSDTDNDIDANDDVDWFQHDDRWRIVAVYRNSNANGRWHRSPFGPDVLNSACHRCLL